MGNALDITGEKFNRLTAVKRVESDKYGNAMWRCKCDCGNEIACRASSLKNGNTKSCGCFSDETRRNRHTENEYKFTGNVGICFLNQGRVAYFDKEDYEKIKNIHWCVGRKEGYVSGRDRKTGKVVRMHRLIMGFPEGADIDHINHNKQDNRKCNLRVCTRAQNMMNVSIARGASGHRGVFKKRGKYFVDIKANGKTYHLGTFDTLEEACDARERAEIELYGEFKSKKSEGLMDKKVIEPDYYNREGRKPCIIEMQEKFGAEAVYWFCICNAYKYRYRAGLKGDTQTDIAKAEWYEKYAEGLKDKEETIT